uniref:hypothetical protein n=1 Tax=Cellvibrio fontiphilus TaxID=1815559 RepID=UPI002B4BFA6C|nr:hypothetical protein [Cellvibrio fontiphilus]
MEVNPDEITNNNRRNNDAGFFIPELAFIKIQKTNSQIKLLRQLAQRPQGEQITIAASALEETLSVIEDELSSALEKAKFLTE